MDSGSRRRIISFGGRVEAHAITLESPGSGMIEEISIVEGQAVDRGAAMIELEDDELYANVSAAAARLTAIRALRRREAPAGDADPTVEWKRMAAAEKLAPRAYDEGFRKAWRATIRAPADGRVSAIHVAPGAEVARSQPLVTLVVAESLRVAVCGPLEAKTIRGSRSVTIVLDDGTRCGGAVDARAPWAGGVALTVDGGGTTLLRPGMRVRVDAELESR